MHSRSTRLPASRAPITPIHRGPQAHTAGAFGGATSHAPNAALLIDFDNVTMGIRSDLASELRSLLGSEIIKGKVAVQRAYADWRRYPQYIVPLAESSIDMIMAPAYGSSKKNATDIRLAVDAMELVFTRSEIGTYILLSGDSDFASLVTKLKEYGKYVIGVGIRESSSDLLVMNCDEYYSYNALAGLVKSGDEETVKWDPWELVAEAIGRMQKNDDVMRSDRLKQVMQDIDATFDEKNVAPGYSKFSRFVQDAADKGLLKASKLENGQLEVAPVEGAPAPRAGAETPKSSPTVSESPNGREDRGPRRGRRGRGRSRDREERGQVQERTAAPAAAPAAPSKADTSDEIGRSGERLTRQEAFDLVKRASAAAAPDGDAALSSDVRKKAHALLGRDSESLGERHFHRILRDAHDAEVIDLRRRGDDYEVSLPAQAASVAEQAKVAEAAATPVTPVAATATTPRGMGPRALPQRGRAAAVPPELLMVGVVEQPSAAAPAVADPKSKTRGKTAPTTKADKKPKAAAKAAKGTRPRSTKKTPSAT